jgi:hypothetical protein
MAMTTNMWQINILTNNQFQMEDEKICEVGHFFNFHFKHIFWLINSYPNLMLAKKKGGGGL